jgi:hypothetical protein
MQACRQSVADQHCCKEHMQAGRQAGRQADGNAHAAGYMRCSWNAAARDLAQSNYADARCQAPSIGHSRLHVQGHLLGSVNARTYICIHTSVHACICSHTSMRAHRSAVARKLGAWALGATDSLS